MCLRISVKIAPDNQMKSLTYKLILVVTMIFGFVIFSHYEALLATTLIVESDMPYNNWEDVLRSGKTVLVWETADSEMKFKVPPKGTTLRKIYDEQIDYINDIGHGGSIPGMINDEYLVFEALKPFEVSPEYPCQIVAADSQELR